MVEYVQITSTLFPREVEEKEGEKAKAFPMSGVLPIPPSYG